MDRVDVEGWRDVTVERDVTRHLAVKVRLETLYREVGALMQELFEHPIGSTTYYLSGAESAITQAIHEVEEELRG